VELAARNSHRRLPRRAWRRPRRFQHCVHGAPGVGFGDLGTIGDLFD
jgi:hypothetical protein